MGTAKHPKDNYIVVYGRPSQVFAKVRYFPDLRKIRPPDGYRTQPFPRVGLMLK